MARYEEIVIGYTGRMEEMEKPKHRKNMTRREILLGAGASVLAGHSGALAQGENFEQLSDNELRERLGALQARQEDLTKLMDDQIKEFQEGSPLALQEQTKILGDITNQLAGVTRNIKLITDTLIKRLRVGEAI